MFHSNLEQSWNIKSNHILMEMIPSTLGTQDFRLIWNEQTLTNLDINEIHCWILVGSNHSPNGTLGFQLLMTTFNLGSC